MWGRQARSYRRAPPGVRPPANPFLVALPLSAGQSGAERGHFEAAGCAAWKRPEASERAHVAAAQRFDAWNRAALAQRAPVLPTQWLVAGVSEPWDYVTNYGALQTEGSCFGRLGCRGATGLTVGWHCEANTPAFFRLAVTAERAFPDHKTRFHLGAWLCLPVRSWDILVTVVVVVC